MFRFNPEHSGFNTNETVLTPPLELKWKVGAVGAPNSPVVYDGVVYVKFGGTLFARDTKTGTLLWSKPTPASDHSSAAVAYDMVFDGSGKHPSCENCGIVAYNAKTGAEQWRLNISPKGARNPNIKDGVLYFGSDDWYVRAVNAYTGQLLWTSPNLREGIVAVPTIADGKVFVGTWGRKLYALNEITGLPVWEYLPNPGGVLFPSQTFDNNTLYFGAGLDNFWAIDSETKAIKWISPKTDNAIGSSSALAYGKVFFISGGGTVYGLDTTNGSIVWSYKTLATTTPSRSSPAVAKNVVYVGSKDGYIYGLNTETGEVLWKYLTEEPMSDSSPAIADGMLFVASDDGYLYAFGNKEVLPELGVPDIKQYSSPWNNDVYDTATRWTSNPTIERWGCALTSISMVLQYFDHSINPDALNNWLNSQPDGYLRNGLVNWLAVSRYTKINSSDSAPVLEFRRLNNNQSTLVNELKAGRPAILRLPGHYVVAKSQTSDSFGINDPGYSDRTTLSSYANNFEYIASYIPSYTDLSYIMLVVNGNAQISIKDKSGNPISEAFSFDEGPLVDDLNGTDTSGDNLKTLLLPTPQLENYLVEVNNGQTPFTLDAYAYDIDGNLLEDAPEVIESTVSATFQLNYDSDPATPLIDSTPPVITYDINPLPNENGWNNSDVNITWTVIDQESEVISVVGCETTSQATDTDGIIYTCTAESLGGISSKSVTIKRDSVSPSIPIHLNPPDNSSVSTPILFDWSDSNDLNFVKYIFQSSSSSDIEPDGSFSFPSYTSDILNLSQVSIEEILEENYFWHIKAIDDAGNESRWSSPWKLIFDNTPPEITYNMTPSPNSFGWNNSDVNIIWNITDAESPISSSNGCEEVIVQDETLGTVLTCTAESLGGRNSQSVTIKIDKTPPNILIKSPKDGAKYILNFRIKVNWSASDLLSGLNGPPQATMLPGRILKTNTPGPGIFTVLAEDLAGNTNSITSNYLVKYNYTYFSPVAIDRNTVWKVNKIPVEFQLKDAFGRYVTNAIAKLKVENTTIFGQFKYNYRTHFYTFNMPTRLFPFAKPKFLTLEITLDDGTTHIQKVKVR